ncbi:MAG TPA: polysaccharide deacetylase family protein [Chitinophagaceae bacterium]|nr:polysaccharide deacetylase family protein [Chitinophagaceae bacterium]MCC6635289.1 polysaccharide deacetylase family protein [Chitinophagaceae bacterium]HMZ46060.1 polysaccharide deacetylase family protein [Chitinophagaceae bacterium]HNF29651.1 polysaccharide deacetylase family protein [Chitinophagaceae bacterium]HNM34763.1 polysaccharide deacetylase family protein [Chitinophagaceae bacterium]
MFKLFSTGYLLLSTSLIFTLSSCGNSKNEKVSNTDSLNNVQAKPTPGTPIKYDSSKRYIFLTWDDSPQPPGTTNCLKIFKEEGVKSTFFAVGFNQVGPHKKRIIDSIRNSYPNVLLANHSFSHGFNDKYTKFYNTPDSAYNDFMRNERDLNIGVKIIRLPGNNTWAFNGKIHGQKADNAIVKKLDANGYKIIGWDLEWMQQPKAKAPKQSVEEMIKSINQKFDEGMTNEANMLVILSHDRLFEKQQYADSLRKFIQVLKSDPRNVFETIDHYPLVQNK